MSGQRRVSTWYSDESPLFGPDQVRIGVSYEDDDNSITWRETTTRDQVEATVVRVVALLRAAFDSLTREDGAPNVDQDAQVRALPTNVPHPGGADGARGELPSDPARPAEGEVTWSDSTDPMPS